jgi:hypothetical protein
LRSTAIQYVGIDVELSLSSAGCSGVAVVPEEFIVQLDGVAGTRRRSITPTKPSSHGHLLGSPYRSPTRQGKRRYEA